jgi:hypothetical protein
MAAQLNGESPEQTQARLRAAERAHDEHNRRYATNFTPLTSLGTEALKAGALINGGSAAAILAFFSQVYIRDRALAHDLVWALGAFGIGLFMAASATGFSYFSQLLYGRSMAGQELAWEPPFVHDTKASKLCLRVGLWFQALAIATSTSAYLLAFIGGWFVIAALWAAASRN